MADQKPNILNLIVKALDKIIKSIDVAINSFFKFLDYLINAVEEVSKKIVSLFTNIFKLTYYILPFILMVILGLDKNWLWLTITGSIVLILVAVLFLRDFIGEYHGKMKDESKQSSTSEDDLKQPIPNTLRIFIMVLVLNILLVGYAIAYYIGDVSIETYIAEYFRSLIDKAGRLGIAS